LRRLQETLTEGLSRYKKTALAPGDEIAITVFRNEDLTRRLVLPADGKFFYPLVGEVAAEGRTAAEVREAAGHEAGGLAAGVRVDDLDAVHGDGRIAFLEDGDALKEKEEEGAAAPSGEDTAPSGEVRLSSSRAPSARRS
jgi:hypothetical protein